MLILLEPIDEPPPYRDDERPFAPGGSLAEIVAILMLLVLVLVAWPFRGLDRDRPVLRTRWDRHDAVVADTADLGR